MRKKSFLKYSSLFLCAAITAASLTACGTSNDTVSTASGAEEALEEALTKASGSSGKNVLSPNSRQETVYIFSDASGNTDHISVHEKVVDKDGNETLTKSTSTQSLPVTMKVTYTLDGKTIDPADLAGKSGALTIRFDYTNHMEESAVINGNKEKICVPFTMITGLALPTDVYSNVTVTNGTLSQVGDDIVAVGMTMPGLSDTLDLKFNDKALDLEIPEFFEVHADVQDFSLAMTMSVATSNLLTDVDADQLTLEDLESAAATLQDSANQLEDGSDKLAQGTDTLVNGVNDLKNGSGKLTDGSKKLVAGSSELADGSKALVDGTSKLSSGTAELLDGSKQLVSGTADLVTGSDQLTAGALQLKSSLESGIAQASASYQTAYDSFYKVAFAVNCMANGIDPANAAAEQQAVIAAGMAQAGLSQTADVTSSTQYATATGFLIKNYSSVQQVVAASISAAAGGTLDATALAQKADEQIVTMTSGLSQAYQAYSNCSTTLSTLDSAGFFTGMLSLNEGAKFLSAGTIKLHKGALALTDGVAELTAGANKLYAGSVQLKEGTSQLDQGLATLAEGISSLQSGAASLQSGALTLKDGMVRFNTEGIAPVCGLIEEDAATALDTLKAVIKAGQNYQSYLGRADEKEGSVLFIYKTEGIDAE